MTSLSLRPVLKAPAADPWFGRKGTSAASWRELDSSPSAKEKRICWPVVLFLIALVVPWEISVGSLRMSIYRIVLLVMLLPCLVMWATGRAGRIRMADGALVLFSLWSTLGLVVVNGIESAIEPAGIGFIETVGAYLLARCYIRNEEQFYGIVRVLFWTVLFLAPFAVLEFLTGDNVSRGLFAAIGPTVSYPAAPPRWGLTRVQSVFDHPILFGVYTGSIISLSHIVLGYQEALPRRSLGTLIVGGTAFMSLSAGPISAVVVQGFLLTWNGLLRSIKNRWAILAMLVAFSFISLEIVANRSALNIVASLFVFDSDSYWFRRLIWDYGTAAALKHPLFGIGLGEWERPAWMPQSIDNFWLIHAVLHGLPAAFLMPLAFFSIFLSVAFKRGLDVKSAEYRTGFLITMTAFFLVGWTVHFWNATYVLFLFLMGSGVWILDVKSTDNGTSPATSTHTATHKPPVGRRRGAIS